MNTELSLDEKYLVRLFRCLPGDKQDEALVEFAIRAIRANLLPEQPDGLSLSYLIYTNLKAMPSYLNRLVDMRDIIPATDMVAIMKQLLFAMMLAKK